MVQLHIPSDAEVVGLGSLHPTAEATNYSLFSAMERCVAGDPGALDTFSNPFEKIPAPGVDTQSTEILEDN